jgi:hypothetical protein
MAKCTICGADVKSVVRHTFECHSEPPPIEISGKLTPFKRADDGSIPCPVDDCDHKYPRRSNMARHLKITHGLQLGAVSDSPSEKRSFSSSLESLSDGTHKKAKLVLNTITKTIKSEFLLFALTPILRDGVEAKPRFIKKLQIRSSDLQSEASSPGLSESLPSSPCPQGGSMQDLIGGKYCLYNHFNTEVQILQPKRTMIPM